MKNLFLLALVSTVPLTPDLVAQSGVDYVPRKVTRPEFNRVIVNETNPPTPTESALVESAIITNKVNPEWLKPPTAPFTLGPGDKIEVELLNDVNIKETLESRQTLTVGPDGKIYFSI